MIRRTSSSTQRLHLLYEERNQRSLVLNGSLGHGIEIGLIGGTTTFRHHHKLILSTFCSLDVNLCRQVATGIHLVVHVQRCILRVAQVILREGVEDTKAQRLFILETRPYLLTFLTVDNGCTRVLTEREDATCSHLSITQELQGHILIIL